MSRVLWNFCFVLLISSVDIEKMKRKKNAAECNQNLNSCGRRNASPTHLRFIHRIFVIMQNGRRNASPTHLQFIHLRYYAKREAKRLPYISSIYPSHLRYYAKREAKRLPYDVIQLCTLHFICSALISSPLSPLLAFQPSDYQFHQASGYLHNGLFCKYQRAIPRPRTWKFRFSSHREYGYGGKYIRP